MLKMDYVQSESHTLPIVDLHIERRTERRHSAVSSKRYLAAILALVLSCPVIALPMTLQALNDYTLKHGVDREWTRTQAHCDKVQSAGAVCDAQAARWSHYNQSRAGRVQWDDALLSLGSIVPNGTGIEQLQLSQQSKTVTLVAQGVAKNTASVNTLLKGLAVSRHFSNVELEETAIESVQDKSTAISGLSFKIGGPVADIGAPASSGTAP